MNKAKGKEALRARRERALNRRREELHKWIHIQGFGFEEMEHKQKIERATKDIEDLERKLGVKT